MARQDEFVRIALRLPPELHRKHSEPAGAAFLNAGIVGRLEASFSRNGRVPHLRELNAEFDLLPEKIAKARAVSSDDRTQAAGVSLLRPRKGPPGTNEEGPAGEGRALIGPRAGRG